MTRKILFITAAAMLVFSGAAASAKPTGDSQSERIDSRDGSHDADVKTHKKAKKKSRKHENHDERHDCGLKQRADGETGARSPDDERSSHCPASDDHGRSDDDHGKKGDDDDNDGGRRRNDRVRSDDHD